MSVYLSLSLFLSISLCLCLCLSLSVSVATFKISPTQPSLTVPHYNNLQEKQEKRQCLSIQQLQPASVQLSAALSPEPPQFSSAVDPVFTGRTLSSVSASSSLNSQSNGQQQRSCDLQATRLPNIEFVTQMPC